MTATYKITSATSKPCQGSAIDHPTVYEWDQGVFVGADTGDMIETPVFAIATIPGSIIEATISLLPDDEELPFEHTLTVLTADSPNGTFEPVAVGTGTHAQTTLTGDGYVKAQIVLDAAVRTPKVTLTFAPVAVPA